MDIHLSQRDIQTQRLTKSLITGLMLSHNGHGEEALAAALDDIAEVSLHDNNLSTFEVFHVIGHLLAGSMTAVATLLDQDPLTYWQEIALDIESALPREQGTW